MITFDVVSHWTPYANTPDLACLDVLTSIRSNALTGGHWKVENPVRGPAPFSSPAETQLTVRLTPTKDRRELLRRVQVAVTVQADSDEEAVQLAYCELANADLGPWEFVVAYGAPGQETARIRAAAIDSLSTQFARQRPAGASLAD